MKEPTTSAGSAAGVAKSPFRGDAEHPALFIPSESASPDNEQGVEDSQTNIRRVLSHYEIGRKLRTLRLKKKIALVDLGKHTGLSASMLSQLENGKLVPTLPTLARIAMVFDVGLDHFFEGHPHRKRFSLMRSHEKLQLAEHSADSKPKLWFESLAFCAPDKSLQAYIAEFPQSRDEDSSQHSHEGSEFFHVLDGSVTILYQGETYQLNSGDSAYFDSSEPHSYRCSAQTTARALVIITPPRT